VHIFEKKTKLSSFILPYQQNLEYQTFKPVDYGWRGPTSYIPITHPNSFQCGINNF
jgi:hypothetical protein